jgi:hypothetical protein
MEKKLDTSWFDLKKYERLKELDLYGWERQISARQHIKTSLRIYTQLAIILFESIKVCPIIEEKDSRGERWGKWRKSDANHPYNTNSVFSIPAESLKLFSDRLRRLESPNRALLSSPNNYPYRETVKLSEAQPDLSSQDTDRANCRWPITPTPLRRVGYSELPCDTPAIGGDRGSFLDTTAVMIDLSASDEQIKKDFDHWLSEFRKATRHTAEKENIAEEADLAGWVQKKLLPYIDLRLAAELDGLTLGHAQAAKLIFPDLSGEPDNKIRRTTKRNADWLMKKETLSAIQAQLRSMTPE